MKTFIIYRYKLTSSREEKEEKNEERKQEKKINNAGDIDERLPFWKMIAYEEWHVSNVTGYRTLFGKLPSQV